MAEDPKLATFVRDQLPTLRERLAPLRVIAFGSRVRGNALPMSDLDLILVSPRFASRPFLKRPVAVLELLDFPAGLELLCYTPEEFEEKRVESFSDPRAHLYYRYYVGTRVGDKYLCVVVKVVEADAFVLTAYLTDILKRGVTLWPRES